MKFIDLFSGMGGFRIACEQNGLECVFSADNDRYACETYQYNFFEYPLIDIQKYDIKNIPKAEILCAGFPCQPFSIGGFRKGFDDTRGTLFFDIARIIQEQQPEIFILENVKGLVNHDKGNTFNVILENLANKINGKKFHGSKSKNLGYNVYWKILNSFDYGLPQNRERVFIVGFKNNRINFEFPKIEKRTLNLTDVLDKSPVIKRISDQSFEYINYYLNKHKLYSEISELDCLLAYEIRKSRVSFRFDNNSPCLTTKMGTGGNNVPYLVNQKRFLSIKECLKLQGFPENFSMTKSYTNALKQKGNSVSVPVVDAIIKQILKVSKT